MKLYAQIETGLPHSQKFRQLNHKEKWAYLCAHLSPLGGYIGTFRYPQSVWADDADLSRPDLKAAIAKMQDVGLVTFNAEESFVQIVDWFLKKNAPENASRMASIASDFAVIDAPDEMVISSAAEFAVGAIKRAQRWKPDSPEWGKLRDVFKPFLATMRQDFEDDFHAALASHLDGRNRAVKAELGALMPSLLFYLEPPCPHPAYTVGAHETTRDEHEDKNETKKDETYTAHFSSVGAQPPAQPHSTNVGDAEKGQKLQGPHSETIEAAKRIGAF